MCNLIFIGDIAIPDVDGIDFQGMPKHLKEQQWIGNLEGSLVDEAIEDGVYNNTTGFKKYLKQVPLYVACLANNHITDTGSISETKKRLDEIGILHLGAGEYLKEAEQPLVTDEVVFLNLGWPVIQCIPATKRSRGVNAFSTKRALEQFRKAKARNPARKIIPIFHWNYELELYPMPRQRELAKQLINEGAELIIGHHSHLVQGIETYKGKYIVHGLGNWAFKQNVFFNKKLAFPPNSQLQMAFEYSIETGKGKCHFFNYNVVNNQVTFTHTEEVNGSTVSGLTAYQNFDEKSYDFFFKEKRLKRKLLPIYHYSDSEIVTKFKDLFLKIRDMGIDLFIKQTLK